MRIEELIKQSSEDILSHNKKASYNSSFDNDEANKVSEYLLKLSSYPYKENTYDATKNIMKIASDSLKGALESIQEKNKKIGELEKVSEVRNVVDLMVEKGIVNEYNAHEKVSELVQKNEKELEIVKEAINLSDSSSNNIFFDKDSSGSDTSVKRTMFDGVV